MEFRPGGKCVYARKLHKRPRDEASMDAGSSRFTRRLTNVDVDLGSVIVDEAGEMLPSASFNLMAGGRVLKCAVVEVGCRCSDAAPGHRHRVLSAEGLAGAIDIRAGNVVVLRKDGGMVAVEETAYALK